MNSSRKAAEASFRRGRVLEAAEGLVRDRGADGVSMHDIAVAAGYTRRTLYNYFQSFDEILLSIYVRAQAPRWEEQREAMDQVHTGIDKLMAWGTALWRYRRQNPHYGRLEAYWDYHGVHRQRISRALFTRFRGINDELAEGLREVFRRGVADGTIRSDLDVDLCISQFLHGFRAILRRAESSAYSFAHFEEAAYVRHYLDLYVRAIRPCDNEEA